MLAYLSRYTHRVAIANSRLIAFDDNGVTFKWKDYRATRHQRSASKTLLSGPLFGIDRETVGQFHPGQHR